MRAPCSATHFWARVAVRDRDECWEWQSTRDKQGYGVIGIARKQYRAQRIAYALVHGECPDHLLVRHLCHNPACVNPDHLRIGTVKDNAHDSMIVGRLNHGSRHQDTQLTEADVREIRRRCAAGEVQRVVGLDYGIAQPTVSHIVVRDTWKHVA